MENPSRSRRMAGGLLALFLGGLVTALVYSHDHVDHIGDAPVFVEAARKAGVKLRIIGSRATAQKMSFLNSSLPRITEAVAWPKGSFRFEGLKVSLQGFERAAHTDDHGIWLLEGEKVAHLKAAVGKAMGEVAWGTGVEADKVNAHTPFLPAWLGAISKKAADQLRPRYGQYYGFEAAVPRNAEMVAMSMVNYR